MINVAAASMLLLLTPTLAVPVFNVDLDLPPEERWVDVAKHYKEELIAMHKSLDPVLKESLGKAEKEWLDMVPKVYDADLTSELKGIVKVIGEGDGKRHLELMELMNLLYEVASPTQCSAVLWAAKNGTVYHGRNMDYAFHFKMPSGKVLNWNDVTFDVIFSKNKKPLFRSTHWPGQIGATTAMHYGGWSFQQNTRPGNDRDENFKAAKQGGKAFMLEVRKLLETTDNFKTAMDRLYSTKLMAPSYFILSGSGAYEGAVLSLDRLGQHLKDSPSIQKLNGSGESWHLVQTNDDLTAFPMDPRRPVANAMLKGTTQEMVNEDNLMQFMHTPTLFRDVTVFSTVMVPTTGYYKTVLPNEAPSPEDGFAAAEAMPLLKMSADKMRKRKAFYDSVGKLSTDFEKGGTMAAMADLGPLRAFMMPAKKVEKKAHMVKNHVQKTAKKVEADTDADARSSCPGTHALSSIFVLMVACFTLG